MVDVLFGGTDLSEEVLAVDFPTTPLGPDGHDVGCWIRRIPSKSLSEERVVSALPSL